MMMNFFDMARPFARIAFLVAVSVPLCGAQESSDDKPTEEAASQKPYFQEKGGSAWWFPGGDGSNFRWRMPDQQLFELGKRHPTIREFLSSSSWSPFWEVTTQKGENGEVSFHWQGRPWPPEQVSREGTKLVVRDAQGRTLFSYDLESEELEEGRFRFQGMPSPWKFDYSFGDTKIGAAIQKTILGIQVGAVDHAMATRLGVNPDEVVMVASVENGLPAFRAGLQPFDVLTKIDGKGPLTRERLRDLLSSASPGDRCLFDVIRNGQRLKIPVKLMEAPGSPKASFSFPSWPSTFATTQWPQGELDPGDLWSFGFGPWSSPRSWSSKISTPGTGGPMKVGLEEMIEKLESLESRMKAVEKNQQAILSRLDKLLEQNR